MTAATAYLVKPVVENIFEQKDTQMLMVIPFFVIVVFFVKGVGDLWIGLFVRICGSGHYHGA